MARDSKEEETFDTEIEPLVLEIKKICQQNDIPYMLVFQLQEVKPMRPSLFTGITHAVYGYVPGKFGESATMRKLMEMFPEDE